MADNIQNRNGIDCFAFTGPRKAIWHRKGNSADDANVATMTWEEAKRWWRENSGHNFEVVKVPAIAAFNGELFDHFDAEDKFRDTEFFFLTALRAMSTMTAACARMAAPAMNMRRALTPRHGELATRSKARQYPCCCPCCPNA